MKSRWTEIYDTLQPDLEPAGALSTSMRRALERLLEHDGEGFVSHGTALALERRGLVTLSAASAAPAHSWVAPQFHATLTAKGREVV